MIVSKQNAFIKQIRSLQDKKNRDQLGLYVAEGVKTVNEAISRGQDVVCVVGTEKGLSFLKTTPEKTEIVSEDVFKSISTEVSPQGVLAVIKKPLFELSAPTKSCVLLDGVADPSNVGAIIRTAVASGYTEIFLTPDCADPYGPKAVRASMSGIFAVKTFFGDRVQLVGIIDKPFIIADMQGENVFTFKPKDHFCLVIGNEGKGVSETIKNNAKYTVSIPMQNDMESLNAGVSAGILMYLLKNSL